MLKNLKVLTLIIFGLLNQVLLFGQNNNLIFSHFTSVDGLSESAVFAITQDQNGFMWFGTRSGLNKFDGYSFLTYKYDEDDTLSISGNEITSLIECKDGALWIGTRDDGLNRLEYSSQKFYNYDTKKEDGKDRKVSIVNSLFQTKKGELLIATNGGLVFYDSIGDQLVSATNKILRDANIRVIAKSSDEDCVWIGAKTGAFLFNVKDQQVIRQFVHDPDYPHSLSSNYVTSILEDMNGNLWIATYENGLNKLNDLGGEEFQHYKADLDNINSITSDVVRLVNQDQEGRIWVGTKIALEELPLDQQESKDPKFIHHRNDENYDYSPSHSSIYSFFEDKNGDLWVGTYNGGVNYLYTGAKKFERYQRDFENPFSLDSDVIHSFEKSGGNFWIGTDEGLNLLDRETGHFLSFNAKLNELSGFSSYRVKALKIDHSGCLWIGTNHGLFSYDATDSNFQYYLKGEEITTIEEGLYNEIWVGTSHGLKVYDSEKQTVKQYLFKKDDESTISNNLIKKVFRQRTGRIWIGTRKGLNYYDRSKDCFVRYRNEKRNKSSISDNYITSICEDNDGDVWIGTFNGINRFDSRSGNFNQYTGVIPSDIVLNTLFDQEGYLWITTNKELLKCSRSSDDTQLSIYSSYDRRDGLQGKEFKLGASYKAESGELLFGGAGGFNLFNPKVLRDNSRVPDVVFTDLKLFNKSVEIGENESPLVSHISTTKSIILTHEQSIVGFCYASLNYLASSKNQYAYKLEGFEETWNYVGDRREATYTSLPAGSYTFRVIASNNDGLWNMKGALLKVTVLPPWWETWWFRGLMIFVLVLLVGVVVRVRFRILGKQKQLLEKKVLERTHELEGAFNKLKNTQSQLIQSEKMASIGLLTSGVAHEINNPLNFIQGSKNYFVDYINTKLVEHKKELDPMMNAMQSGLDRTSTIVSSLNQFNRKNLNYAEQCNVHEIVDDCLVILQGQLRDRINVAIDYSNEYSTIVGNQGELHQLILNVLSNAEQSMAVNGDISIKTQVEYSRFVIRISDTGEGISKENLDKITDPFFTTKEPGKGVGLGMSISFSIVKRHKGTLKFQSKEGQGTTVVLTFPIVLKT